jgi:heavy metal translocating P-type ATPase
MHIFINKWIEVLTAITLAGLLLHGLFYLLPATLLFTLLPLQVVLALGVPLLGFQVLQKALAKDFGADMLALLALVTGVALQEWLAGVLIVLMLSGGQLLEQFAVRKASSVLEALSKRLPSVAHRKQGELIEDIPLSAVALGDKLLIFPHETAPVDGVVCEGQGTMDESYLTGEPYHVTKAPGSSVLSGAINGETALLLIAEKLAVDSRYASIMGVMQEAEQKRPTLRRLGDQIGAVFTPVALLFALAAWAFTGDSGRFLSVLVVATPCPLLIAIPISLISAISLAAKRGIIIKDPMVLERLPTCRTAIFDKTGTLTYGKPTLVETIAFTPFEEQGLLQAAASLERYSKHPLASAFLEAAAKQNLSLPAATNVSEKQGEGLQGELNGALWQLTSRQKLRQHWPTLAEQLPETFAGLECVLLCDQRLAGVFRLRDAPRAEGHSFISHLAPSHKLNKLILLSGDRASEVAYLAETLGLSEAFAEQSPEQKVALVRAETALAPTLFMGDGINDAPALATATVGLAFGQHSNVTSEAAGAVILDNTLYKVDELLHISIALRTIALQSAIGGMLLSVLGMALAAFGLLSPVQGALAQEVIDVLAIANALRLVCLPLNISELR